MGKGKTIALFSIFLFLCTAIFSFEVQASSVLENLQKRVFLAPGENSNESLKKILCESSFPSGRWEDGECKIRGSKFSFTSHVVDARILCEMLSCIVENGNCICGVDVSPLGGEVFPGTYDIYYSPLHGWVLFVRGRVIDEKEDNGNLLREKGRYRFMFAKLTEAGGQEYIWKYMGGGEFRYYNSLRLDGRSSGYLRNSITPLALSDNGFFFLLGRYYVRSTYSNRSGGWWSSYSSSYYSYFTRSEYSLVGCLFNKDDCSIYDFSATYHSRSSRRTTYRRNRRTGRRYLSNETSEKTTESIGLSVLVQPAGGYIPPEPVLELSYQYDYSRNYRGHPSWYSNSVGRGGYYACDVYRINRNLRQNLALATFQYTSDGISVFPARNALCYEAPKASLNDLSIPIINFNTQVQKFSSSGIRLKTTFYYRSGRYSIEGNGYVMGEFAAGTEKGYAYSVFSNVPYDTIRPTRISNEYYVVLRDGEKCFLLKNGEARSNFVSRDDCSAIEIWPVGRFLRVTKISSCSSYGPGWSECLVREAYVLLTVSDKIISGSWIRVSPEEVIIRDSAHKKMYMVSISDFESLLSNVQAQNKRLYFLYPPLRIVKERTDIVTPVYTLNYVKRYVDSPACYIYQTATYRGKFKTCSLTPELAQKIRGSGYETSYSPFRNVQQAWNSFSVSNAVKNLRFERVSLEQLNPELFKNANLCQEVIKRGSFQCALPDKDGLVYEDFGACLASCTFETECRLELKNDNGIRVYYVPRGCKYGEEGFVVSTYLDRVGANYSFSIVTDRFRKGVYIFPYGGAEQNYMGLSQETDRILASVARNAQSVAQSCPELLPKLPAPGTLLVSLGNNLRKYFSYFSSCSGFSNVTNISNKTVYTTLSEFYLPKNIDLLMTKDSRATGRYKTVKAFVLAPCVAAKTYKCEKTGEEHETLLGCLRSCN